MRQIVSFTASVINKFGPAIDTTSLVPIIDDGKFVGAAHLYFHGQNLFADCLVDRQTQLGYDVGQGEHRYLSPLWVSADNSGFRLAAFNVAYSPCWPGQERIGELP